MLTIKPLLDDKKDKKPLFIAGPCSVESKEQLLESVSLLQTSGKMDLFRCGVWKPRSSPNSFEGVGKKALSWLKEIETTTCIPVCIEIGAAKQLETAVKTGIRFFWIGARTSVNPFLVQEIASASQGMDIGMMIKNPLSPDLNLWFGNFERFAKVGIQRMAAVFRGFSTGNIHPYRNDPMWQLLIEFKRTHREIPVYCDPSHIAGKRKYVFEIAQKALFLDVDGLMTEVHPYPAKALSDKEQQLSVSEYVAMTDKLLMPSISELQSASLEKYREALDAIDNNIIYLLAERFEVVKKIACYKKENNLPVLQINRWENMRSHILSTAQEAHLDAAFITAYLELLHNASIQYQQEIIREHQ